MKTRYIIEQVKNGWTVTKMSYNVGTVDDDKDTVSNTGIDLESTTLVFQDGSFETILSSEEQDCNAFVDLLYYLIEEIGPDSNRDNYAKHQVHVEVKPGRKCESLEDKCAKAIHKSADKVNRPFEVELPGKWEGKADPNITVMFKPKKKRTKK